MVDRRSFAGLLVLAAASWGCPQRPQPLSLAVLADRLGEPIDAALRARLSRHSDCSQRRMISGVRVEGCLGLRGLVPSGCGHAVVAFIHPAKKEDKVILAAVGALRCPANMARVHLGRLWGELKDAEVVTQGLYRFSHEGRPDGYLAELPSHLGLGLGASKFGFGVAIEETHPAYISPAALLPP